MKKGEIWKIEFWDHALIERGEKKDKKILKLYVVGRVYSTKGKQIVLETWWTDDKENEISHEWAKVLKTDIIKKTKLTSVRS